jgi:hypothetical protein
MRRRIWCETLPYEALNEAVLQALRHRSIELLLAVRPPDAPRVAAAVRACRDAGVRVSLWPMLDDAQGRWASAINAEAFARFLRQVVAHGCDGVAFDLEPPIERMRALLGGSVRPDVRATVLAFAGARGTYADLARELKARKLHVVAAVLPLVLFDREGQHPTWQKLLGTPVDGVPFDHVSVMLYTSLLEGWSRGMIARKDARGVLGVLSRAAAARFGSAAGVSLGAVGTGAFGDEPVYRSPDELADDVAIARAAGVDDLTLFDLGGAVARGLDVWLDAFVHTAPARSLPEITLVSRAALSIADASAASVRALAPLLRWGLRVNDARARGKAPPR